MSGHNNLKKLWEWKVSSARSFSAAKALSTVLLATLPMVPQQLDASNTMDIFEPAHPLNPVAMANRNNFSRQKNTVHAPYVDLRLFWLSAEEAQQMFNEFDILLTEAANDKSTVLSLPILLDKFQHIWKKHNLTPDQLKYVFMQYYQDIIKLKEDSSSFESLKKFYSQEELAQKIENIYSYQWSLSLQDVVKNEFSIAIVSQNKKNLGELMIALFGLVAFASLFWIAALLDWYHNRKYNSKETDYNSKETDYNSKETDYNRKETD